MAESGDQRYHGLAAMHATIICLTRRRTGFEPLGQGAADLFSGWDAVALFDFLEGGVELGVDVNLWGFVLCSGHKDPTIPHLVKPPTVSLSFQKLCTCLTLSLTRFVSAIILPA